MRSVTAGQQMLVAGPHLYITTRAAPDTKSTEDVISVLDTKTGALVAAYEVKTSVIDMAVFGKDLVLATGDGLKLIARKGEGRPRRQSDGIIEHHEYDRR